jgi:outer membrane lipoprotein SlyB
MLKILPIVAMTATVVLTGCQQPGANLESNVYRAGQVNQRQDAKVVDVLAVLPAKIEVDNQQARATAQLIGGVAGGIGGAVIGNNIARHSVTNTVLGGAAGGTVGALAGSLVPTTTLVEGVSLTYIEDGKTLNSAQVGRACEFKPGNAIVISTGANETRIQPNNPCPVAAASKS